MRPLSPVARASIGKRRADDGGDDLVQVGQSLDRVGEGLFIDGRVLCPDAVADRSVGYCSDFNDHGDSLDC